ncbi:hypothetical protein, partial [Escherichia coli]|uniref:hypothetical protein n=2 Tax=Escherichia coli TaxID=562 RepID=UPI001BC8AE02
SELLLCHGMVCVVGRIRDLILQLSKSSIYSTKPINGTPSVSETRKPDKVRLRPGTGALIILISAPLGRGNLGVIVINCMQKPRKKHGSEYFCT